MIDYTKVREGQRYWYACLRFTSSRRDKISRPRSTRPVQFEVIEKIGSGGFWGITSDGIRIYINISTARYMFDSQEDAIEFWNYNLQDAIEYQEYRRQEVVKGLKKNMIQGDDKRGTTRT